MKTIRFLMGISRNTEDRNIEDVIEGAIQKTETASFLALEPSIAERLLMQLKATIGAAWSVGHGHASAFRLQQPTLHPTQARRQL